MRRLALGTLFISGLALAPLAGAASLEDRIARLERMQDNKAQVEMLMRLNSLQQEVQQLRGLVEEQNYQIDNLKQRQRELYLDIDRRLSGLERGGVANSAAVADPGAVSLAGGEPAQGTGAGMSEADMAAERDAYQKAFDLLRELRYEQATIAFAEYLKSYPNGRYSHTAQYWLAEANYAQRKFQPAIGDYQKLLSDYADSPKRADAMLKIGYSYNELGKKDEASKILEQLIKAYPKSTEAGQAQTLLKQLKK